MIGITVSVPSQGANTLELLHEIYGKIIPEHVLNSWKTNGML